MQDIYEKYSKEDPPRRVEGFENIHAYRYAIGELVQIIVL